MNIINKEYAAFSIEVLYALLVLILFLAGGILLTARAQSFKEISLQSKLSTIENHNGIAVADYDNDNDLDIFLVTRYNGITKQPAQSKLFRNNNNGTFSDVTSESGIHSEHAYDGKPVPGPFAFGEKMSVSWGDYDNDGFADLFLTSVFSNELYRNNQDGTFTDVTTAAGLPAVTDCYPTGALWFDANNDAFLDLYVTSVYTCRGIFYQNNGDGTFSNTSTDLGLESAGLASWMSIPWDINKDGFQDLYVTKDFDLANEFFLNNGGNSFVDKAKDYGVTDIQKDGMGIAQADYNNDGLLDVFITNINESSLYKNMGADTFVNVAEHLEIDATGWAWGCQFEDFDHDLDVDLIVANGFHKKTGNRFYENHLETGNEGFLDKAHELGMDEPSFSNGLVTFDYDNDGDLDILIARSDDHPAFFENQLNQHSEAQKDNWLQIKLEGTTSNRDAIGTRIEVTVGGLTLTRYYHGASLLGQSLKPVHFGLADYTEIDQVTLTWPGGNKETFNTIPVNAFVHITENEGFETVTLSSKKIPGCTDPNSCSYNPDATFDDGSCTYLDSQSITGELNVGILSTHSYSYPSTTGSTYQWSITGGTIVDGQGEASVTVQWGIAEKGKLTVIEKNDCSGLPVTTKITFNITDIPENVSVARMWNEALLEAIRRDYARPTVHARNLFHTSVALYDAWALFDDKAETYVIGKTLHGYENIFKGFETKTEKTFAAKTAMSYAAYRLLSHRFKRSPNKKETQDKFDALMDLMGYNRDYTSTVYDRGNPAALGNFIAQSIIEYGYTDGSNELNKYANTFYVPRNEPLAPDYPGNPSVTDPNHWQPLQLEVFIDQAGNITSESTPDFLGPEWGNIHPFALKPKNAVHFTRDGNSYTVYHNPGAPPNINELSLNGTEMDLYKWNFSLVSVWSAMLNPFDGVNIDISPASMGNIALEELPTDITKHNDFYDLLNGGDISKGREINPVSGEAYETQEVPRGDYARVLAEFWADGPDSETPPGHWFVLLNYVSDQLGAGKKFKGEGDVMDPLEWDVKAYFAMAGTMHDAAITAWGIKGWYDYIRPISAIRYMADQGQSSNPDIDNYHEDGIPLIDGYIEVVETGDSLEGKNQEHIGKIKLFAWKGHSYINDTDEDQAGVGWILAENWWPYQRPSFVTPPFAGYVSGHSTYSRAAAEVMTLLTGTEYFPGGMGEFVAPKNEFLVFEEGPSQDVVLQWATYRDASDQCSLSRIWGGIHPPCDDIPGRIIGAKLGREAFAYAETYFDTTATYTKPVYINQASIVYPVPVSVSDGNLFITHTQSGQIFNVYDLKGSTIEIGKTAFHPSSRTTMISLTSVEKGIYMIRSGEQVWKIVVD